LPNSARIISSWSFLERDQIRHRGANLGRQACRTLLEIAGLDFGQGGGHALNERAFVGARKEVAEIGSGIHIASHDGYGCS